MTDGLGAVLVSDSRNFNARLTCHALDLLSCLAVSTALYQSIFFHNPAVATVALALHCLEPTEGGQNPSSTKLCPAWEMVICCPSLELGVLGSNMPEFCDI